MKLDQLPALFTTFQMQCELPFFWLTMFKNLLVLSKAGEFVRTEMIFKPPHSTTPNVFSVCVPFV